MYRRLLLGMTIILALFLAACQQGNPYDAENRKLAQDAGMPDGAYEIILKAFSLLEDSPSYKIISIEKSRFPQAFYEISSQAETFQSQEIWCVILDVHSTTDYKFYWAIYGNNTEWVDAIAVSETEDMQSRLKHWTDAGCSL